MKVTGINRTNDHRTVLRTGPSFEIAPAPANIPAMEPMSIKVRPRDSAVCEFQVEAVLSETDAAFDRAGAPYGNEMVDAILGLPAVERVEIEGGNVTVSKSDDGDWRNLEEPIAYAIQLGAQVQSGATAPAGTDLDEDELFDTIEDFFAREVNPAIASHGGKIELIDMEDYTLVVRMMGGCQGCGMANVTLKQGIESSVKQNWPVIKGIRDITDHAAGTNPYFQAEKK